MDIMRIAERVARKGMGIPPKADPYKHPAFRRYLATVQRRSDRVERALRKILEQLPETDKKVVILGPGSSGRRLFWWINEGLKEYNPNNVRLHRIKLITLPVSARDAVERRGNIARPLTEERLTEMVLNRGDMRIYRNLVREIKAGKVMPVFVDAVKVSGRTERIYREFFKRLGVDFDSVPKIILADRGSEDVCLWDFAANLIESPYAFPAAIEKKRTELNEARSTIWFNRYVRRHRR